jgi:hypothetical protein
MPATATDIGAATRAATIVSWASATIAARYPTARDGAASPAPGWFDLAAHAQAMIDARGGLLGVERRRFAAVVQDELWLDPAAGVPTARLIDGPTAVDAGLIVARLELDLEAETTSLELFG